MSEVSGSLLRLGLLCRLRCRCRLSFLFFGLYSVVVIM